LDEVTVTNPATGQILVTTQKVFKSIYVDKGFELVDRKNASTPIGNGGKRVQGEVSRRENKSVQASGAADIAAKLGLAAGSAAADDAGSGVTSNGTNSNEDEANANESAISEERQSGGRDRGRN
jgi:hypothetical protein